MKKGKKFWILLGTASMAGLLSLISILIQIVDLKRSIKPSPDITMSENISVNYLTKTEMDVQNMFYLFDDDIAEEKDYYFNNYCATIVSIENNYDEDIEIKKVFFEAYNINQIKEPYFEIYFQKDNLGSINVHITNTGWSASEECSLSFSAANFEISDYLQKDSLELNIPSLAIGESITVPFLSNDDLLLEDIDCNETLELSFEVQAFSDDGDEIGVDAFGLEIWIVQGELFFPGRGGAAIYSYGIQVDTSQDSFKGEEVVSDVIKAGEIKTIPVCFFADCSCELQARIGFEILHNGRQDVFYSQYRNLYFYISSIPERNLTFDVKEYTKEELEEISNNDTETVMITYPYME